MLVHAIAGTELLISFLFTRQVTLAFYFFLVRQQIIITVGQVGDTFVCSSAGSYCSLFSWCRWPIFCMKSSKSWFQQIFQAICKYWLVWGNWGIGFRTYIQFFMFCKMIDYRCLYYRPNCVDIVHVNLTRNVIQNSHNIYLNRNAAS